MPRPGSPCVAGDSPYCVGDRNHVDHKDAEDESEATRAYNIAQGKTIILAISALVIWNGNALGVENRAGALLWAQSERGGDGNAHRRTEFHNVEARTAKAAQSSAYSCPARRNGHDCRHTMGRAWRNRRDGEMVGILGVVDGAWGTIVGTFGGDDGEVGKSNSTRCQGR